MPDHGKDTLPGSGAHFEPLVLRGGLKGRLRRSLNVLDTAFEALDDYLRHNISEAQYHELKPLLGEVGVQFSQLQRLTEYTADAALGSSLNRMYSPHVMDLIGSLRMVCDIFSEEVAGLRGTATVRLECGDLEVLAAMAEEHMLSALLCNLISNAMQARPDCTVTFTCAAGCLTCRDDGPGLSGEAAALLEQGTLTPELTEEGGIGLLLIHQYATAMGWKIRTERPAEGGAVICFDLPPLPADWDSINRGLSLESAPTHSMAEKIRCGNRIHREILAAQLRREEKSDLLSGAE